MKFKDFIEMVLLFEPFGLIVFIVMILGFIYGKKYSIWFLIIGAIVLVIIEQIHFWRFKKVIVNKLNAQGDKP